MSSSEGTWREQLLEDVETGKIKPMDAALAEEEREALKAEAREVMREELTERIRDFEYLAAVAEEAKKPFSVLYPPDRPFRQFVELVLERDRSDWDSVRARLEKELQEL